MSAESSADDPGDHVSPAAAPDPAWFVDALRNSSDLVLVIDRAATVLWCNAAAFPLLGRSVPSVIGRSLADFVHPEDLVRAAEVISLEARGAFDRAPITPALYRVQAADGRWVSMEVNASSNGSDGSILLVARIGGDLVLADQLLEAVTGGEAFERQVELVLEMGQWRHPDEGYAIFYRDEDGEQRAAASNLPPGLYGGTELAGATPWDAAMVSGAIVVVDDIAAEPADSDLVGPELAAAAREAGFTGCLAAPVDDPIHPAGSCIAIWTSDDGPTTSGHRYAMSNMRRAFALVLQQRAQVGLLERAARVDHLTGATSRARFLELLDDLRERAEPTDRHALLYIDLDGFKVVNDSLGHAIGDRVLTAAAGRLVQLAPAGAVVARLGGDEFVVLCPPGTSRDDATSLAQRLVEAIAEPIEVGGDRAIIGASIGVAVGDDGESPQAVLDAADVALFAAKARGRGRWLLAPAST